MSDSGPDDDSFPCRSRSVPDETAACINGLAEFSADIHRFVRGRLGNEADAADIAQQALLRASKMAPEYQGDRLRAWLFTVAKNLITDYYRYAGRREFVDFALAVATEPGLRTSRQYLPDNVDQRQRLNYWLWDVVHLLEIAEQIAVLLADVYGYPAKDAAPKLEISVSSYKLLLHDARKYLRETVASGEFVDTPRPDDHHKVNITCPLPIRTLRKLRAELLWGIATDIA